MSHTKIKVGVAESLVDSAGGITLSVPLQFKRRSGRRLVTFPNAKNNSGERPWDQATTPLQLALAKGFVWLRALEAGEVATLRELAKREGVDNSYVTRLVNLTLLPPWTIAAILEDRVADGVGVFQLAVDRDLVWRPQS